MPWSPDASHQIISTTLGRHVFNLRDSTSPLCRRVTLFHWKISTTAALVAIQSSPRCPDWRCTAVIKEQKLLLLFIYLFQLLSLSPSPHVSVTTTETLKNTTWGCVDGGRLFGWITWHMLNLDQNATYRNWAADCQRNVLSQCITLWKYQMWVVCDVSI